VRRIAEQDDAEQAPGCAPLGLLEETLQHIAQKAPAQPEQDGPPPPGMEICKLL